MKTKVPHSHVGVGTVNEFRCFPLGPVPFRTGFQSSAAYPCFFVPSMRKLELFLSSNLCSLTASLKDSSIFGAAREGPLSTAEDVTWTVPRSSNVRVSVLLPFLSCIHSCDGIGFCNTSCQDGNNWTKNTDAYYHYYSLCNRGNKAWQSSLRIVFPH